MDFDRQEDMEQAVALQEYYLRKRLKMHRLRKHFGRLFSQDETCDFLPLVNYMRLWAVSGMESEVRKESFEMMLKQVEEATSTEELYQILASFFQSKKEKVKYYDTKAKRNL